MRTAPGVGSEEARAWRPAEIEEPTNRWFIHRLSWVVARWCARWGVHPNTVSLLGLACGIGAAVAYGSGNNGWTCAVGFLCMVLWHVFDGADGQLARLTGKASEWGKVMDGLCDHGTFLSIYAALVFSLAPSLGIGVVLLGVLAGLSHFVQATAYERQRQLYEYVVLGKPTVQAQVERVPVVFRGLYRLYLAVQQSLSGERQVLLAVSSGGSFPEGLRHGYRQLFRPLVHAWSALSSNYRTLALFGACCLEAPELFFWWELIGLNGVLVGLVFWTRCRQQQWLRFTQAAELPTSFAVRKCVPLE